jgi:RimJ/RimL family protein N-acetyltransferase
MPFSVPWTDVPERERQRQTLQHLWGTRVDWTPEKWRCPMAVLVDGGVVGAQDVGAEHFAATRCVTTGSWLTQSRQGQGIGKEMRTAILHLAFEGLGAQLATTSAYHDNAPSLGVTRALGYEPNGTSIEMRRDVADTQLHFLMTRAQWESRRRDDITIEGLEPCLEMFGVTA